MYEFCANVSTLFLDIPLEKKLSLAASCGFKSIEVQYPYELKAKDLSAQLAANGQSLVLMNAPLGPRPYTRGLAVSPEDAGQFKASVNAALTYAAQVECKALHVLSGTCDPRTARDRAEAQWEENFSWAAAQADDAGVTLLIEALNPGDVPGYFIRSIDDALWLIRRVNHPRLKLLYDTYHCEMSGTDCADKLSDCIEHIRHVQIADCPGRAEPGTGQIAWRRFFDQLQQSGYAGKVGCEFRNRQPAPGCFDWMRILND